MVLGYFQQTQDEEIMVTKEDIFGINVTEPWTPEEIEEVLKEMGKVSLLRPWTLILGSQLN